MRREGRKILLVIVSMIVIGLFHCGCEFFLVQHIQIHNVILKLFYIPIVMGAFWWGLRGGSMIGVLSAAVYGIEMIRNRSIDSPQFYNDLSEIVLFIGVGTLLGWMADHDRACRLKRHEAEARAEVEFRRSITDPLTGTFNRRYMDKILGELLDRAKHGGKAFFLLMVDLNGFKLINDRHGHLAGDQVLRSTAQILFQNIRQTDYVFRYGGDEFVILLPDATQIFAFPLAKRMRRGFDKLHFSTQKNDTFKADFSIGIIEYHPDFENVGDMLAKLDEALYRAKKEPTHIMAS